MIMLGCADCGHDTCQRPGLRFCPACGGSLVKACQACRHEGLATDRHCGGCGVRHRLPGEAAVALPYAQLPADEARRLAAIARATLASLTLVAPVALRELADARRA